MSNTIAERVENIKTELQGGNAFGERVTLVAATKMQTAEAINEAIQAGVDAVAENKPQEFRDKNEFLLPCSRHFIGHLQTNKIKYLIGKISLYHSCDREELANELARQSLAKGLVSDILIQINIGDEATKGGYAYAEAKETFARLTKKDGLRVKGFMAMLPDSDDETLLRALTKKMRELYDWAKTQSSEVEYLSMGMSGDYRLCIEEGSNMIRLGSTIFGARDYGGN
ncbi:MAG: YggS family pyridoxal phosphate-dependent enzyme [Clostridia bacterium]|nr:YggS family pyridoxal phosphate-dependent enzyme [Clostridia bacterium]